MRQLIGFLVQLGIGERLIAEGDGDGVGSAPGLLLEDALDRTCAWIYGRGLVPVDEQLLFLRRREDRDLPGGLLCVLYKGLKDGLEVAAPALNGRFVEEAGVVVAVEPELVTAIDEVEEEIHVDMGLGVAAEVDGKAVELEAGANLLDIELHFDQRQPRRLALNLEFTQQRSVGVVLMILRVEQLLTSLLEELRQRLIGLKAAANGKEVDAVAHQRSAIIENGLAGHGDADDHIILLREAVNELREAGKQRGEERAALLCACLLDGLEEFPWKDESLGCAFIAAHGGTRPVGGQLQSRGRGLEFIQPIGFDLRVFLRPMARVLFVRVLAEGERRGQ